MADLSVPECRLVLIAESLKTHVNIQAYEFPPNVQAIANVSLTADVTTNIPPDMTMLKLKI
jgi:hypothetical protein